MGNRGWGDFGLAAAELIGARKVSGGELRRMAPKNYQLPTTHYPLPTNNYPLKSHECTNGMFLRIDWSKEGERRGA